MERKEIFLHILFVYFLISLGIISGMAMRIKKYSNYHKAAEDMITMWFNQDEEYFYDVVCETDEFAEYHEASMKVL